MLQHPAAMLDSGAGQWSPISKRRHDRPRRNFDKGDGAPAIPLCPVALEAQRVIAIRLHATSIGEPRLPIATRLTELSGRL